MMGKDYTNKEVLEEVMDLDKEEDIIKHRINRNRNDDKKKKYILYGVIIFLIVIGGVLGYIILSDDDSLDNKPNDEVVNGDDITDNDNEKEVISYVACDDNTALLNVRNSTSGNIIDGLSCYREVVIEEEIEGNEVCDNWYKISYNKKGNSYTGYVCGTYIKNIEISRNDINKMKNVIDKSLDYYMSASVKPYCGATSGSKMVSFDDNMTGEYVKSEYKNIEQIKNYLYSFMDKSLIKTKLELSDINNPKYFDNYYMIDGDLYCRNYYNKGFIGFYTGNYDIEVTSVNGNNVNVNIAYEYVDQNSDCSLDNLNKCSRNDFVYDIGKVVISDGIITKMDFYK